MSAINKKVEGKKRQHTDARITDSRERKLLDACDRLDKRGTMRAPGSKLTQATADKIRARVEAGATQKSQALAHHVSEAVVSAIVLGRIWNPAHRAIGTRGVEMRRRIIGAIDTGLRAGELLNVQIKHVAWSSPEPMIDADGKTRFNGYRITLPPAATKGGKTTGEAETVYCTTLRLSRELEARRFALRVQDAAGKWQPNPEAYIFGTEAGRRPAGFKRQWRDLFALAGIPYGRAIGMVFHTLRHEFITRVAEDTGDGPLTQALARHADFETTAGYIAIDDRRKFAALAGSRGSKLAART